MAKLPFPKAILFDFDGVVVDSEPTHMAAWASAFKEIFNKEICPFPVATHAGKAPYQIAEYFAEYGGDITKSSQLNTLKQEHLMQTTMHPNLLPGINEIETFLQENNISYGIASNAYTGFLENTVNALDLKFPVYMGVDKFEKPKPDPEAYITLAKALGVTEKDFDKAIIFEDSLTGIRAAKASGMVPVGILTQYSEEELLVNGAFKVFPTVLEAYQEITSL